MIITWSFLRKIDRNKYCLTSLTEKSMQILMAYDKTIVFIDASKQCTTNLNNFIKSNFSKKSQYKNSVVIDYVAHEYHSRVFLIKWLYTLHTNIKKSTIKDMRNALLQRIEKPIKIEYRNKQVAPVKISIKIINEQKIHISLVDFIDFAIIAELKFKLNSLKESQQKMSQISLDIDINNNTIKKNILNILKLQSLNQQKIQFIYDKKALHNLLKIEEYKKTQQKDLMNFKYLEALKVLEVCKDANIDTIQSNYKKLLRKYHPDRVQYQSQEIALDYTLKFQSIQNAFDDITNLHHTFS